MRTTILLIVMAIVSCSALTLNMSHPNPKITLYVFNDETNRPGQTLKEEFWGTHDGLDTVEMAGARLVSFYLKKFNTLKYDSATYRPTKFGVYDDFYHSFAFVFT